MQCDYFSGGTDRPLGSGPEDMNSKPDVVKSNFVFLHKYGIFTARFVVRGHHSEWKLYLKLFRIFL